MDKDEGRDGTHAHVVKADGGDEDVSVEQRQGWASAEGHTEVSGSPVHTDLNVHTSTCT